jgi:hypothetical protein
MNLDPKDLRNTMKKGQWGYAVVLHEFGHATGLTHEHLRPDRKIKFKDNQSVYDYYRDNQEWDKGDVDFNVLNTEKGLVGTLQFDPKSIMMYSFATAVLAVDDPAVVALKKALGDQTKALAYPVNTEISAMDKEWIKLLYPADGQPRSVQDIPDAPDKELKAKL